MAPAGLSGFHSNTINIIDYKAPSTNAHRRCGAVRESLWQYKCKLLVDFFEKYMECQVKKCIIPPDASANAYVKSYVDREIANQGQRDLAVYIVHGKSGRKGKHFRVKLQGHDDGLNCYEFLDQLNTSGKPVLVILMCHIHDITIKALRRKVGSVMLYLAGAPLMDDDGENLEDDTDFVVRMTEDLPDALEAIQENSPVVREDPGTIPQFMMKDPEQTTRGRSRRLFRQCAWGDGSAWLMVLNPTDARQRGKWMFFAQESQKRGVKRTIQEVESEDIEPPEATTTVSGYEARSLAIEPHDPETSMDKPFFVQHDEPQADDETMTADQRPSYPASAAARGLGLKYWQGGGTPGRLPTPPEE